MSEIPSHLLGCLKIVFEITNLPDPLYVGIVYRPPSGSKSKALEELEKLIQKMPRKRIFILGDFNQNLFKPDSHVTKRAMPYASLVNSHDFESLMYSNNMTPLISLATHFKPDCNLSLIDNILTNCTEYLKVAGQTDFLFY